MKKLIFAMFVLLLCFNTFADYDMSELADEEATYQISADLIEVQRDQTELEKQSILQETQYRVKLEVLRTYINEVWALYTSSFIMVYHLFLGFIIVIFMRGLVFLFIDFLPFIFKKGINIVSGWIEAR